MTATARWTAAVALAAVVTAGCNGLIWGPGPAGRINTPRTRCAGSTAPGSPHADPEERPLFFLFCVQNP